MDHEVVLQTMCIAAFLGIAALYISEKINIPAILLLFLFGILAGPQVSNILHVKELTDIVTTMISVGVGIILFEGGMTLNFKDFKIAPRATINIIIFGPFITLALLGVIFHYTLHLGWDMSLLTAAVLIVTGPTVVAAFLKRGNISKKLREILTWEAIIVEALGGVFVVVVFQFVVSEADSTLDTLFQFVKRLLIGGAIGFITGKILTFIIPRRFVGHNLLNLVIIGIVIFMFWVSNHFASESGLLAVAIAGIMVGQIHHPALEEIKHFKEQISMLTVAVIFILLSARFDLNLVTHYGWNMVLAIAGVLLVARPLMIFITTLGTKLNWKEKVFLGWTAPRGEIAAATAALFTILLHHHYHGEGGHGEEAIETIVFLTILSAVVLQGFPIPWVAKWLGVQAKPRDGYLILGVNPFSMEIAKKLKEQGLIVKLMDHTNSYFEKAKELGIDVYNINYMDEEEVEGIGLERIGTLLALTSNDETNTLVCRMGQKILGRDHVYQVVNTYFSDITDDVLLHLGGRLAFDMKMSVDKISERIESDHLHVEKLQLEKSQEGFKLPDNFLSALFFIKPGQVWIAEEDEKIKTGTIIALTLN